MVKSCRPPITELILRVVRGENLFSHPRDPETAAQPSLLWRLTPNAYLLPSLRLSTWHSPTREHSKRSSGIG